jgi:TRAP-type C4-dicarboxylate transport system permease small subunit
MSLADAPVPYQQRGTLGRAIYLVSVGAALLGGALLSAIALMSVASIVPRSLGLQPIQGDFELVQVGLAICVTSLLPWCQLQGGNITVDFFTARMRKRWQRRLDAIGSVLFALVIALVAWRTGVGAASLKSAGETTMLLGFPLWIGYAAMTPGLGLTSAAALYTAAVAWVEAKGE